MTDSAVRAALEHIRRCVRFEPSMNARVVVIHEGSATMDQIDAALAAPVAGEVADEPMTKPCDNLRTTCDAYPACVCGRAWRQHTASAEAGQINHDAGATPCESPRPVPDARLSALQTPGRQAETVAQSRPASPPSAELDELRKVIESATPDWWAEVLTNSAQAIREQADEARGPDAVELFQLARKMETAQAYIAACAPNVIQSLITRLTAARETRIRALADNAARTEGG